MIGTTLGPYRIDRELGSGGMGQVYAATVEGRCPGLDEGTRVALKIVHPHLLDAPGFFKRFLREGEIGKAVRHENVMIARCAAAGRHDVGMRPGAQPRENEVHVRPAEDNVVKGMDLGVARLADEHLRLSQSGAFVGWIQYAAPEQFRSAGEVDHRAERPLREEHIASQLAGFAGQGVRRRPGRDAPVRIVRVGRAPDPARRRGARDVAAVAERGPRLVRGAAVEIPFDLTSAGPLRVDPPRVPAATLRGHDGARVR